MAIELTREELFKQVWERPMTKVAADYGISDVALKKICDKHRVPVPGRGYWAKKAAGKKVKQAHFRAVSDPNINRVVIYGSAVHSLAPKVKQAMETAKKREKRKENKVEVTAYSGELHYAVERVGKKLEKAKPDEGGIVSVYGQSLFSVHVGANSVSRVITFLNAFVVAAEERGYRPIKGERSLVIQVDGEPLAFSVVEQTRCVKHTPTELELVAVEKWEKRQSRRTRNWDYIDWTPRPTIPEWDYEPSGKLQVRIDEHSYDGIRRMFGDGKTQRIEDLINAILVGLATCAAAIKAKREEDERRRIEHEVAARRRQEQQRRDALERKRIEALSSDLERWQKRCEILDYVAAVEAKLDAADYENPDAIKEWTEWAKDYAEKIDPIGKGLPRLLQFDDFHPWELR